MTSQSAHTDAADATHAPDAADATHAADATQATDVATIPDRAAFIVGVSRSGTSLLLSLLDGHPEVLAVPLETKVFQWCHADDPVQRFFDKTVFGKRLLDQDEAARETFERVMRRHLKGPGEFDVALRAVAAATAAVWPRPEARVWLEKTPRHRNQLPMLLERFGPQTRALVTVRDPRATFASHKARWDRKGVRAARRFARKWLTVHTLTQHYLAHERGVTVTRYEDFVLDTRREMARIAAHLGIADHPALRVPTKLGEGWAGNSSFDDGCTRDPQTARARDAAAPPAIGTEGIDRWRSFLDDDEVRTIEALLGPAMRLYGYEPRDGKAAGSRFSLERWRLQVSTQLLLNLRRRRWGRSDPGEG